MNIQAPDFSIEPEVILPAESSAVLIIDMIFDFVDPRGKLFVEETRKTIAPIQQLIRRAREAKVCLIYIQDWHRPDDPEFAIWGAHAVQDSEGIQIDPALAPSPQDFIVRKRTYDPFFATDLDLLLRQKKITHLVITGTVANICVLHAAGSARLRGYQVIVPVDTISALQPFDLQIALRQITFVYQGKLTRSEGISFQKRSL
jgi:nicotinamidase-related amidase